MAAARSMSAATCCAAIPGAVAAKSAACRGVQPALSSACVSQASPPSATTCRFNLSASCAKIRKSAVGSAFNLGWSRAMSGGLSLTPYENEKPKRGHHRRSGAEAAAKNGKGDVGEGKYKDSVNLPVTKFDMRANSVVKEPQIQKLWAEKKVEDRLFERSEGEPFILHDGPPYANGDLHIGHALNKILKDIINRYQILQGRKVKYIPGWDCHGLPIELKVLQSMSSDQRKELTPIKLRKKAAQFAVKTVDAQREQFKRYGIWGDWDQPYLTLKPEYEAAQIGVFGKMVLNGHIYRGKKPVHWSPSSQTALAEAELEYPEGHVSRSIYVAFPMTSLSDKFPEDLKALQPDLSLAIWTTTPWTMPGNAAVAVNGELDYAVVELQPAEGTVSEAEPETSTKEPDQKNKKKAGVPPKSSPGNALQTSKHLIVAKDLVPTLEAKWGVKLVIKGEVKGAQLEGSKYRHPLFERKSPVVIGGDYITTESGTGLVHIAPGHGQEDYITGLKYDLPLLSPVNDRGDFTEDAGKFQGLNVLGDGNTAIVTALNDAQALLLEEAYSHKYPYDWRTKKPTIFRATEQWFASVTGFKQQALDAISTVTWIPAVGQNRITAMTVGRNDWCISRQRNWGVPIPVFYDKESGEPLMTEETIAHVQGIVREKGTDAWFYMDIKDLLPERHRADADKYRKGTDTMDVWFDSGSSWSGVVDSREGLRLPSDLVLEGSDQHRGWFQSSLLTSVASNGKAPYKSVLTHGFVLDERGLKMSKSLGNVIDPRLVINGGKNQKTEPPYGADVLRLWVSSVDYTGDVLIGPGIIRQMSDTYRKFRGTLRYLLGNLSDFDPSKDALPYSELPEVDRYTLSKLAQVMDDVRESYDKYQFYRFYQLVQRFLVVDLSNFYFDICKDRLYIDSSDGFSRRAAQTVLSSTLLCLVRAIAPVLPHMAEDAWQNLPFKIETRGAVAETVFEGGWPEVNGDWRSFADTDSVFWSKLLLMRNEVNKVIEAARNAKLIGASLEAKAILCAADPAVAQKLRSMADGKHAVDQLRYMFITSQVEIVDSPAAFEALGLEHKNMAEIEGVGELLVGVVRADGSKCERCWNYSTLVGNSALHPTLCERCEPVIEKRGAEKPVEAVAA